ncbi:Hrp-dependent type III effector protein [Arthrobacter sp. EpRS66]|nr:Hrp-dependent type III effector protein [Arthrobacter sp. EpRS66]
MSRIGFVADDLTGAADVLAQAHANGINAALVIGEAELPEDVQVLGVAGPARSLGGQEFDDLIRRDVATIAGWSPDVLLYKVCSTFDSSPVIGSIGRGIELLRERYEGHGPVPVVPAQPSFGRYTSFGHHFANYKDRIYRLDLHPVMSQHPSTPMDDSELSAILARQFESGTTPSLIALPAHEHGYFAEQWKAARGDQGQEAFIVDACTEAHLDAAAQELLAEGTPGQPSIVVGSGGIMAALTRTPGTRRQTAQNQLNLHPDIPVLAVSASASSTTAQQIAEAAGHGWTEIPVPQELLHGPNEQLHQQLVAQVAEALRDGRHVVVHSTKGASDPRFAEATPVDPSHLGALIGDVAAQMAEARLTADIAVFGGDTSSHALIAMGVSQLRVAEQFVTAGPIVQSHGPSRVAGCNLLLKGGQVGPMDILQRFAQLTGH